MPVFGERLEPRILFTTETIGAATIIADPTDAIGSYIRLTRRPGGYTALFSQADTGVLLRGYDASGSPLTPTVSAPVGTDIASDASGNVGIVGLQTVSGSTNQQIVYRLFNADLSPRTPITPVNTHINDDNSAIGMAPDGRFVIAWVDYFTTSHVVAQRYDANGNEVGSQLQLSTDTKNRSKGNLSIAMDANGNFAVAWAQQNDAGYNQVHASRISWGGTVTAPDFIANTPSNSTNIVPACAINADGVLLLLWSGVSGGESGLLLGTFDPQGHLLASPYIVDYSISPYQPRISIDADEAVVVWTHPDADGSAGVFARRYSTAGAPLGSVFQVNSFQSHDQIAESVVVDSGDIFVGYWGYMSPLPSQVKNAVQVFDENGTAPQIQSTGVSFDYDGPIGPVSAGVGNEVELTFSGPLGRAIQAGDYQLRNLTAGTTLASAAIATNSTASKFFVLQRSNNSSVPAAFSDGNWKLSLSRYELGDALGNPIASDISFEFFSLSGDANHDRRVNALDLNALASHFGSAGTFSQGDFNYDGAVNTADFTILAAKFGIYLAPPATPAPTLSSPAPQPICPDDPDKNKTSDEIDDLTNR